MANKKNSNSTVELVGSSFGAIQAETTRWREPIAEVFDSLAAALRDGADPEEVAIICDNAAAGVREPASKAKLVRQTTRQLEAHAATRR